MNYIRRRKQFSAESPGLTQASIVMSFNNAVSTESVQFHNGSLVYHQSLMTGNGIWIVN
jgi:hypothetical protein